MPSPRGWPGGSARTGSWPGRFARKWGGFETDFLNSLWRQAGYLHDRLEWDLRANHILATWWDWPGRDDSFGKNRLTVAGNRDPDCCGAGDRRVLPDGGHFGGSPIL